MLAPFKKAIISLIWEENQTWTTNHKLVDKPRGRGKWRETMIVPWGNTVGTEQGNEVATGARQTRVGWRDPGQIGKLSVLLGTDSPILFELSVC